MECTNWSTATDNLRVGSYYNGAGTSVNAGIIFNGYPLTRMGWVYLDNIANLMRGIKSAAESPMRRLSGIQPYVL